MTKTTKSILALFIALIIIIIAITPVIDGMLAQKQLKTAIRHWNQQNSDAYIHIKQYQLGWLHSKVKLNVTTGAKSELSLGQLNTTITHGPIGWLNGKLHFGLAVIQPSQLTLPPSGIKAELRGDIAFNGDTNLVLNVPITQAMQQQANMITSHWSVKSSLKSILFQLHFTPDFKHLQLTTTLTQPALTYLIAPQAEPNTPMVQPTVFGTLKLSTVQLHLAGQRLQHNNWDVAASLILNNVHYQDKTGNHLSIKKIAIQHLATQTKTIMQYAHHAQQADDQLATLLINGNTQFIIENARYHSPLGKASLDFAESFPGLPTKGSTLELMRYVDAHFNLSVPQFHFHDATIGKLDIKGLKATINQQKGLQQVETQLDHFHFNTAQHADTPILLSQLHLSGKAHYGKRYFSKQGKLTWQQFCMQKQCYKQLVFAGKASHLNADGITKMQQLLANTATKVAKNDALAMNVLAHQFDQILNGMINPKSQIAITNFAVITPQGPVQLKAHVYWPKAFKPNHVMQTAIIALKATLPRQMVDEILMLTPQLRQHYILYTFTPGQKRLANGLLLWLKKGYVTQTAKSYQVSLQKQDQMLQFNNKRLPAIDHAYLNMAFGHITAAKALLNPLSKKHNATAQYLLGQIAFYGLDGQRHRLKALSLFTHAAQNGSKAAKAALEAWVKQKKQGTTNIQALPTPGTRL